MTDGSRVELCWHERTLKHERPLMPGALPGKQPAGEQVGSADIHSVVPGVAAGRRPGDETAVAAGEVDWREQVDVAHIHDEMFGVAAVEKQMDGGGKVDGTAAHDAEVLKMNHVRQNCWVSEEYFARRELHRPVGYHVPMAHFLEASLLARL